MPKIGEMIDRGQSDVPSGPQGGSGRTIGSLLEQRSQQPEIGVGETLGRLGLTQFLDNVLGLPETAANLQRQGQQQVGGITSISPGAEIVGGLMQRFRGERLPEGQRVDLPIPEGTDVLGGAQVLGETAGAVRTGNFGDISSFQEAAQNQAQINAQAAQQNPIAGAVGTGLGDAATLVTGRARLPRGVGGGRQSAQRAPQAFPSQLTGRLAEAAKRAFDSKAVRSLRRAAGKSAEAGLEGTAISLLNDGDPAETAGFAAGGQLGGSLALAAMPFGGGWKKNALKFGGEVIGLIALHRMLQDLAPGQNNLLDATDFVFNKMALAMTAGALSSVAGAGRLGTGPEAGQLARNLDDVIPELADAITSIPRNTAISLANQAIDEGPNNRTIETLEIMGKNAQAFTPEQRRRVDKAIKNNKVQKTIGNLMKDDSFRRKINRLKGQSQ